MDFTYHWLMTKQNQAASNPLKKSNSPLLWHDVSDVQNRDPGRSYRFVSRAVLESNYGAHPDGWIPINETNHKGEYINSRNGQKMAGTKVGFGDLTLAYMDKEHHEFLQQRNRMRRVSGKQIVESFDRDVRKARMENGENRFDSRRVVE